jgi:hypothetical protein
MKALQSAMHHGLVFEVGRESSDLVSAVLIVPEQPGVRIRQRGERSFHEIPVAEIAAAMKWLTARKPNLGRNELIRETMVFYDVAPQGRDVLDRLDVAWLRMSRDQGLR